MSDGIVFRPHVQVMGEEMSSPTRPSVLLVENL